LVNFLSSIENHRLLLFLDICGFGCPISTRKTSFTPDGLVIVLGLPPVNVCLWPVLRSPILRWRLLHVAYSSRGSLFAIFSLPFSVLFCAVRRYAPPLR